MFLLSFGYGLRLTFKYQVYLVLQHIKVADITKVAQQHSAKQHLPKQHPAKQH